MSKRNRIFIIAGLVLLSLTLSFFAVDFGHDWGDDYSVYLAQAIAISEGRLDEQLLTNAAISFSTIPKIYAWGYSLLLVPIHRLVGFNLDHLSGIIYYKIPVMLCLAAWGAILFIFFSRRFRQSIAVVLALAISCSYLLVRSTNDILTDIPFALFSWIAILLIDHFPHIQSEKSFVKLTINANLIGCFIYLASITRYAGYFLLVLLLFSQIQHFFKRKQLGESRKSILQYAAICILPYFVFGLLYYAVSFLIPYPSTQSSDVLRLTLSTLIYNIGFYAYLVIRFVCSFVPYGDQLPRWMQAIIAAPFAIMLLRGVYAKWKAESHILFYTFGTMITLLALPYTQGFRYIFNILPCVLLIAAYGVQSVWKTLKINSRLLRQSLMALFCFGLLFNTIQYAVINMSNHRLKTEGAFTENAKEGYRYIRENIDQDAGILSCTPRGLTTYTGRIGHENIKHALAVDNRPYYLFISTDFELGPRTEKCYADVRETGYVTDLVFSNSSIRLYSLKDRRLEQPHDNLGF